VGVAKNEAEAVRWYQLAADRGDPDAQYYLGLCYEEGRGIPANKQKAFELFYKSAARGRARAQYRVGWAYAESKNWGEASKWIQKAVDQGYSSAQYTMGISYLKGRGVPKNERKGIELLTAAAKQGLKQATDELRNRGYRVP